MEKLKREEEECEAALRCESERAAAADSERLGAGVAEQPASVEVAESCSSAQSPSAALLSSSSSSSLSAGAASSSPSPPLPAASPEHRGSGGTGPLRPADPSFVPHGRLFKFERCAEMKPNIFYLFMSSSQSYLCRASIDKKKWRAPSPKDFQVLGIVGEMHGDLSQPGWEAPSCLIQWDKRPACVVEQVALVHFKLSHPRLLTMLRVAVL